MLCDASQFLFVLDGVSALFLLTRSETEKLATDSVERLTQLKAKMEINLPFRFKSSEFETSNSCFWSGNSLFLSASCFCFTGEYLIDS